MEYSKQECPKCGKLVKTLYRPSWEHPGPRFCYWCNKKRMTEESKK